MKVFGGSILSHYSRWCPVQARLVQSLETNWEGKRERDREKQKGRKMLGTLLTPSLSQLFTPQRLFLEGKGLTNSFFPPRSAATHPAHFLDVSWKPKLGCCFFIFLGLSNSSIVSVQVQRWTFPISVHASAQICLQDLSQVQHWPPACLAPYPPLLISTTTKTHTHTPHTHTHTHKPSAPLLKGPADPHLIPIHGGGGGALIWAHPGEVRKKKIYAIAHLSRLSVSYKDSNSLCSCQINANNKP